MNATPQPTARRSCAELGVCQGLATPCAGCPPFEAPECADTSSYQPADLWDLMWFYGVVAITAVCSLLVVCGLAGFFYASSLKHSHLDIKTMPEPIESIASIEARAKAAALIYSDINDACPYPFGTDAAHHFKAAFFDARAALTPKPTQEGAAA